MRILAWALQVLILSAGIHLFLRFVRTTRGNRLIRGLLVTVLLGVVGLWGLSELLELEELKHLLEVSTGFIMVTLAIVFQPELRRGIAQLGEHSLLGRLMKASGQDTVARVVRAAQSMASRRVGALIAFERETSLHNYIEEGTPIDSDVNARLIESLFHPGTALHDGAVIIRKDRIAAAGCFLPLPQEADIDPSMGTRHRAAMGLTEDTDAVVLVVSEETGRISVAREGRIATSIASDTLEDEVRAILRGRETGADPVRRRVVPSSFAAWRRDLLWLAGSVLLAFGVLYVAHRDIRETAIFRVRIVAQSPTQRRQPADGEILVVLPQENQVQVSPSPQNLFEVEVEGSRGQIDEVGVTLRGVLEIRSPDWTGGFLDLDRVSWENRVVGISYRWKAEVPPDLRIEEFGTKELTLEPKSISFDGELDAHYERYEVSFTPSPKVTVRGPQSLLARLGEDELKLESIVLSPEDRTTLTQRVRLSTELIENRFSLVGEPPAEVIVPIHPASRELGAVEKEIALVDLRPGQTDELRRWRLPTHGQIARFTILTSGLIPAKEAPGSRIFVEKSGVIRKFVEDNLRVFVDLSDLHPEGEGQTVPVRWTWRRSSEELLRSLNIARSDTEEREPVEVRLDSETEILLEENTIEPAEGTENTTSPADGGRP